MSVYSSRDHDDTVLAAVRAIWPNTGDADIPGGPDAKPPFPYAIVYPLGSATFDGTITDLQGDAFPTTQVSFFGSTREQVQGLQDKIRSGLVGTTLTVAGRALSEVELLMERPASKDTTVTPYVYWAIDQYRVFSAPIS